MVKRIFYIAAGVLCLAAAIVLIVHLFSGPPDHEMTMDQLKQKLTASLAQRSVKEMRAKLPPEFNSAVLLHFRGHRHAIDVEHIVREQIHLTRALELRDFETFKEQVKEKEEESTLSQWLEKIKGTVSNLADSVGYDSLFEEKMPQKELKEAGIDGLLGGEVAIAEGVLAEDKEVISLTLWVRRSLGGKKIFQETYQEELEKSLFNLVYFRHVMDELGAGWKLIIWLVFTILFPLLTSFLPAKLLKLESNKINMSMLVGYTIIDLVLVLFLMGFVMSGMGVVWLLIALALSGVYNYGILTEIQDYA